MALVQWCCGFCVLFIRQNQSLVLSGTVMRIEFLDFSPSQVRKGKIFWLLLEVFDVREGLSFLALFFEFLICDRFDF